MKAFRPFAKKMWLVGLGVTVVCLGGLWLATRHVTPTLFSGGSASSAAASPQSASPTHSSVQTSPNARLTEVSATLTLEAIRVMPVEHTITQEISHEHGYITQLHVFSVPHSQDHVAMSFRIPETIVSPFTAHLESLGHTVSFSRTGVDVTRQYNTLNLQTVTLTDEVNAYRQLFRKATNMKDMLQIQQALTKVETQLQATTQQKTLLTHNVQYASVQLTLIPHTSAPPHPTRYGFLKAMALSLRQMGRLANLTVMVLGWITPWLLFLLIAGLAGRYLRRFWAAHQTTKS